MLDYLMIKNGENIGITGSQQPDLPWPVLCDPAVACLVLIAYERTRIRPLNIFNTDKDQHQKKEFLEKTTLPEPPTVR